MFYDNDIISRQIEALIHLASKILLGSNYEPYTQGSCDELRHSIDSLMTDNSIGECEDLIFDSFDPQSDDYIRLVIDFYHRLNTLDDETLEEADFERDEVRDGLMEFMGMCGIPKSAMEVN